MRRRRVAWFALAVGCGDDAIAQGPEVEPPAPLYEPVCGAEGPYRLLPLEPGEHAYRVDRSPQGDRLLVSTFWVDPSRSLASLPPTLDRVIYALGSCGEEAVEAAG